MRLADPRISSRGNSCILLSEILDAFITLRIFFNDIKSVVGRSVIDNNKLPIVVSLALDTFNGLLQIQ